MAGSAGIRVTVSRDLVHKKAGAPPSNTGPPPEDSTRSEDSKPKKRSATSGTSADSDVSRKKRKKNNKKIGKSSKGVSDPDEPVTEPHQLAETFLRRQHLDVASYRLCSWRGEFWQTNGCRYEVLARNDIEAAVTRSIRQSFDSARQQSGKLKARVTRTLVADVLHALASLTHVASSIEQPAWIGPSSICPTAGFIAVRNGLLDVDALLNASSTNVLRPYSSNWFSPTCLDFAYDPAARCPKWLAFLDRTLEADVQRLAVLQEWFGLCLMHDTTFQKFLLIVGEGADGKTVVVLVLAALLGEANVSHVPLELFGERFQLTTTLGKLLNAATEIGEIDKVAEGLLKQFASGDPMFFDRKHLAGVHSRPTARLMFTTNNLPSFKDRSSGVWRRMLLMPFRRSVPDEQQDSSLVATLTAELPGIFNWAIEGLRRLREQRRFTRADLCVEALDTYRREANPARTFLEEHVRRAPSHCAVCVAVRKAYADWCQRHGYKPLNEAQFGHEVRRAYPEVCRKKVVGPDGERREWAYFGIELT